MVNGRNSRPVEIVLEDILTDRPYFNSIKFLDTARLHMSFMYRALKDGNFTFIENFCVKEFVNRLKNEKNELFDLNSDIDTLSIQNRYIIDYRRCNEFDEIDVNFHTYYVDYMNNNTTDNYHSERRRYIEVVYKVTFRAPSYVLVRENENTCDRCGAMMKKNYGRHTYNCEYCGNTKVIEYSEWKISNVEKYND